MPLEVEPLLDDIYIGDLEGRTIEDYRAWKRAHTRGDAFPAARASTTLHGATRSRTSGLLARPEQRILVVCHEIPVRYAVNAASGSDELDGPAHEIGNCVPYLFDEDGLERAVAGIRRSAPNPDS